MTILFLRTLCCYFLMSTSALALLPQRTSQELPFGERKVRPVPVRSLMFAEGDLEIERDAQTFTPLLFSGELGFDLFSGEVGKIYAERVRESHSDDAQLKVSLALFTEQRIREFVKKKSSFLKIESQSLKFVREKFYYDKNFLSASFDYYANGTKVENADIVFRFSNAKLVQILTRTFGITNRETFDFPSSHELQLQTESVVRDAVGENVSVRNFQKVIFVKQKQSQTGYDYVPAVKVIAATPDGTEFQLMHDIHQGRVLEWFPTALTFHVDVKGKVNTRHIGGGKVDALFPLITVFVGGLPFEANGAGRVEFLRRPHGLVAAFRSKRFVVNSETEDLPLVVRRNRNSNPEELILDDSNSTAAERNVFFHLNIAQEWARSVVSPEWFGRVLEANVNINETCNASWDGFSVNFFRAGRAFDGEGNIVECNNSGEIADVIYHEWGHGLDANTGGIEDRAFSEGIGDVVSLLITDSPLVGPSFFADGSPVRTLDGEHRYPPSAFDDGVPHKEGLIIGSAWYHLLRELEQQYGVWRGREIAKQWFLKSLYTASQYTDVYNALLVLDGGNTGGTSLRGPNFCLINKAFSRHGLAIRAEDCR